MLTNHQNPTKINMLLADCPDGTPMTSRWLGSQGISAQLVQKYKDTGWLEALGRGCWIRVGTYPTLAGSIYALQRISLKVYPAAITALELQGRTHYVPMGESPMLHISVSKSHRLPYWFRRLKFAKNLHVINSDALFDPICTGLNQIKIKDVLIQASSPERAMLEYTHLLPKYADFEEAKQLLEGLPALRPSVIQNTLKACKSIKAKRLFLAMASSVRHHWFDELRLDEIGLGLGNRVLPIEGISHPEFSITVPETWCG